MGSSFGVGLRLGVLLLVPLPALAQDGAVAGRVIDSARAQSIASARIRVLDGKGSPVRQTSTGPRGQYRLIGLAPGLYRVAVAAIGYGPREVPVRVAAGATTTVDLALGRMATQLGPLVVVSPGRSPVPEETTSVPVAITVVPAETIEERTALTVADLLKTVRGIAMSEGGLVQVNPVARGLGNIFSGSLLMMVDHRIASVPSLRVNVPAFFPIVNDDIEQMEVVLGPGAAVYGPNANSGMVHILTKSPLNSAGTTVSIDAGARSSSPGPTGAGDRVDDAAGIYRVAVRHASRISDRVGVKVSGEYLRGTDWSYADRGDSLAPGTGSGPKTVCRGEFGCRDFTVRRWGGEARIDIRPTDGTDWVTSVGQSSAGSLLEPTAIGTAQARDWISRHFQTRIRSGRFFANAFLNTSDAGGTFLLRDGNRIVDQSRVWALQAQQGFDLGRKTTVLAGADYTSTDPRTGGTINGTNESNDRFSEIGGYLHAVTGLSDRLDLIGALRIDHHSRIAGAVWSPRVALVGKVGNEQSVRVSYNRAFSTPTATDLFLDITAGEAGPYLVRALGVPDGGFRFRMNGGCQGGLDNLCMRSPFAPAPDLLPARASLLWAAAVALVAPQIGPELAAILEKIPPAGYQQVSTALGRLNPTTRSFDPTGPGQVQDIGALEPTVSNILEAGYQGTIGGRVRLALDGYYERRENFVGPLIVESPSVFLDPGTLVPLIREAFDAYGVPQAVADQVAAAMAGIPLGTVVPNDGNRLTNRPDIFLTSRNFGTVDLFGADAAIDLAVTRHLLLAATYSWVNKDLFTPEDVNGPHAIALNASRSRGSVTVRVSSDPAGSRWSSELRVRSVKGFPVSSGVFVSPTGADGRLEPIDGYTLVDLQASWRPPLGGRKALIAATVSNLLDTPYATFVGVPRIGRMVMTKVSYTF